MIAPRIMQEHKDHLQSLVSQWENLKKEVEPSTTKYYELYERSKTILRALCLDTPEFLQELDESPTIYNIDRFIGKLRATQLDLSKGLLNLESRIQEQMTIDLILTR